MVNNNYKWDEVGNFEIGDIVTSTKSILITKGFRGVSGEIIGYAPDTANCMNYVIQLEDKRLLYITDWLLEDVTNIGADEC